MDTFDKPMGGTELMFEELQKRLTPEQQEKFSIFNYLQDADFNKFTIFWNQLSYDQEAVAFLSDPEMVEKIGHFVFVSHWQAEKFRQIFQIPGFKTSVIKNASCDLGPKQPVNPENVKLCYTSTPWRGLDVLLRAWELASPQNCELHVFSSCHIYGPQFGENDTQYTELYQKCEELSGVVYRGSIHNDKLRAELTTFDILAYPNTFEETSCISVIEALSAGLRVITSNLGALPETSEGWANIYPFLMDKEIHAQAFAKIMLEEIARVKDQQFDPAQQIGIYAPRWSWETRITEWQNLLNGLESIIQEG